MRMCVPGLLVSIVLGTMVWSAPGLAHDHDRDRGTVYKQASDHERARRARAAGEALSLQEILQRVGQDYPGKVLKVEFERDDNGVWIYELRILQDQGRLLKLKVDARDARVLAVHGRSGRTQEAH